MSLRIGFPFCTRCLGYSSGGSFCFAAVTKKWQAIFSPRIQHFRLLRSQCRTQRGSAQAGNGALDRQHRGPGDAQDLTSPAVEAAGDSQGIDELDADQAERLLTT